MLHSLPPSLNQYKVEDVTEAHLGKKEVGKKVAEAHVEKKEVGKNIKKVEEENLKKANLKKNVNQRKKGIRKRYRKRDKN